MNNEYNLSILEALFKDHLVAEKVSKVTIKNYRSDVKYFINWFYVYIRGYIETVGGEENEVSLIEVFILHSTNGLIEEFKSYLIASNIPLKTINRRLSSIRKFYAFCVKRGYLTDNPSLSVTNHKDQPESILVPTKTSNNNTQADFEKYLSNKLNIQNTDDIIEDYKEFMNLWS
jgi:site-specific recombinase XerD